MCLRNLNTDYLCTSEDSFSNNIGQNVFQGTQSCEMICEVSLGNAFPVSP